MTKRRVGLYLFFAAHGFLVGSWAPHIPTMKATLELSDGELGLALIAPGAGAIATMAVASRLARRIGPRIVAAIFLAMYVGSGMSIAFADGLASLTLLLFVWGAGLGALDVLINEQAADLEIRLTGHHLSGFHASYNAGAIAGSAIAVIFIAARQTTEVGMLSTAAVTLAACGATLFTFVRVHLGESYGGASRLSRTQVLALAAVAFTVFLCEGSAGSWSATYLVQTGAGAAIAGLGYVGFAVGMLLGRLVAARAFRALGTRRVIFAQSIIAATVLGGALAIGSPAAGVFAFFMLGLGMSSTFPVIVSRVGADPRLPVVVMTGYFGLLIGPCIIGGIAAFSSLVGGLALVAALCTAPALSTRLLVPAHPAHRGSRLNSVYTQEEIP